MNDHEKQRHATSSALVALRQAMGKSQTSFAVEDLKVAISTLGRYETSTPPTGDVLLQLSEIAKRENRMDLYFTFVGSYLEQQLEKIHGELYFFASPTTGRSRRSYLVLETLNTEESWAAKDFLYVIKGLRSPNPKHNRTARAALKALHKTGSGLMGHVDDPMTAMLPSGSDDEQ